MMKAKVAPAAVTTKLHKFLPFDANGIWI